MGQRTAILLKKNYADGHSEINLIHHQWGIGKVLPSIFMQEVLATEYPLDSHNMYNKTFKDVFTFKPLSNEIDNYIYNLEDNNIDVWDKDTVLKMFEQTDNNNGGMIIEVSNKDEDNFLNFEDLKIAFVLGNEECESYDSVKQEYIENEPVFGRLVTCEEFSTRTGGNYVNSNFIDCFNNFCKVFGIEQVTEFSNK